MLGELNAKAYYKDLESRIGRQPLRLSKKTSVLLKCTFYFTRGALWSEQIDPYLDWLANTGIIENHIKFVLVYWCI